MLRYHLPPIKKTSQGVIKGRLAIKQFEGMKYKGTKITEVIKYKGINVANVPAKQLYERLCVLRAYAVVKALINDHSGTIL